MTIRHMVTANAVFGNTAAEIADLNSENLTTNYLLKGKERWIVIVNLFSRICFKHLPFKGGSKSIKGNPVMHILKKFCPKEVS